MTATPPNTRHSKAPPKRRHKTWATLFSTILNASVASWVFSRDAQFKNTPRFWRVPFKQMSQGFLNSLIFQGLILFLIWCCLTLAEGNTASWADPQRLQPISYNTTASPPLTIQRQEIQHFFTQHEGNSVRTAHWLNHYFRKPVQWQGHVYQVKHYPDSHRVEILVKVLTDSVLYDTVVIIEGRTDLNSFIQKGTLIQFSGTILNGVDILGVKEVQVLAQSPQAIQPVGDMPVNWQGQP